MGYVRDMGHAIFVRAHLTFCCFCSDIDSLAGDQELRRATDLGLGREVGVLRQYRHSVDVLFRVSFWSALAADLAITPSPSFPPSNLSAPDIFA